MSSSMKLFDNNICRCFRMEKSWMGNCSCSCQSFHLCVNRLTATFVAHMARTCRSCWLLELDRANRPC